MRDLVKKCDRTKSKSIRLPISTLEENKEKQLYQLFMYLH